MSQALEVPQTKAELAKLVPDKGSYLQQTFRLGYAPPETELYAKKASKGGSRLGMLRAVMMREGNAWQEILWRNEFMPRSQPSASVACCS